MNKINDRVEVISILFQKYASLFPQVYWSKDFVCRSDFITSPFPVFFGIENGPFQLDALGEKFEVNGKTIGIIYPAATILSYLFSTVFEDKATYWVKTTTLEKSPVCEKFGCGLWICAVRFNLNAERHTSVMPLFFIEDTGEMCRDVKETNYNIEAGLCKNLLCSRFNGKVQAKVNAEDEVGENTFVVDVKKQEPLKENNFSGTQIIYFEYDFSEKECICNFLNKCNLQFFMCLETSIYKKKITGKDLCFDTIYYLYKNCVDLHLCNSTGQILEFKSQNIANVVYIYIGDRVTNHELVSFKLQLKMIPKNFSYSLYKPLKGSCINKRVLASLRIPTELFVHLQFMKPYSRVRNVRY